MQTNTYTNDRILKIAGRIRKVFYIFACMGILVMTFGLIELYEGKHPHIVEDMIFTITFLFLYIGLKYRKKWFIPLVLISSTYLFLNMVFHIILHIHQPVSNVSTFGTLISKIFSMFLLIFSFYQMNFFSRPEVKIYFGSKNEIFF